MNPQMATSVRYGHCEGPGKGREYPTAANQYFHNLGGHFVKLVAGDVTLCASGDTGIAGWAVTPKHDSGKHAWKSSASDSVFVIYGLEDVFEMPVDETAASLAVSFIGHGAGIANSGATYALKQKAKISVSATPLTATPLSIVDVDTDAKTVFVKVKPGNRQAV